MAGFSVQQLACLALALVVTAVLYILPLVLRHGEEWALLGLLPLIFLPVPWFFVKPKDSFSLSDPEDDQGRHWAEFFTTLTASGVFGIPLILWHIGQISLLSLLLTCGGALILFSTFLIVTRWQSQQESDGWYSRSQFI
mmetsp:Transcript_1429/g.4148  ORF Transcript_1429/g.4148 Transcript_1429/m.4148 type:complete len:139 (+) Transcript_1429:148-564(+)